MLPEYRTILCAMDPGHHTAPRVLRHALSLADRFGGEVVVVHAVESLGPSARHMFELYAGADAVKQGDAHWRRVQDEVQRQVREFCGKEGRPGAGGRDMVAEVRVLRGRPSEVILQESARIGADLIVLGAHGHSTVGEILLGTTAHRVAQRARVPVLLVHISEADTAPGP